MKLIIILFTVCIFFLSKNDANAQSLWGIDNSRTDNRDDAGLQGNNGAVSGFFQTINPLNYPAGASGWWHLLDVRHSNPASNLAMQFAGSSYDQNLYFRKTIENPLTPWSRVLLETNGKVGIGTTSPVAPLDVNGYFLLRALSGGAALNVSNLADQDLQIHITAPGASDKYSFIGPSTPTSLVLGSGDVERVRITNTGDFGIGTTNPQSKLDVSGSGSFNINLKVNGRIQTGDANNQGGIWLDRANSLFVGQLGANLIGFYNNSEWRMVVDNTGNVGIGTTNPQAKLAVNGDISSKKIKVTQVGWPDYVFEPTYKLWPLPKLEAFVNTYKHLPEVPSADEIEKNGLDVGENQTILLKKVEELTLYLIEQDKQQALTKEIILRLNKQIETMQMIVESQAATLKEQQQLLLQLKKQ